MKAITVLGIDLAKEVFQLCGRDDEGKVVLTKKLRRAQLTPFLTNLPRCTVAMEACASSNHWGRVLLGLGHEVRIIPPQYVKPFVKTNKNDSADAEAITEAALRPTMRFVPVKTRQQQDIQSLHRVRTRLVTARTALINETVGLVAEYGIPVPKTESKRLALLNEICSPEHEGLSGILKQCVLSLMAELKFIREQVESLTSQIEHFAKQDPASQLLLSIPGVGVLTATALSVYAGGRVSSFKNGRQFAASLGLVPRQHSSGGRSLLLGISKRGDPYIRTLLVHGGRSVLRMASKREDRMSQWAAKLKERRGTNRAIVAVANKNARIAWAVLARGKPYCGRS